MSNKRLFIFIFVVFLVVCLAPFVFTRPAFCEKVAFVSTGQIGDTIGGITAPIIGLCSILLLILTLKAQLDFNKVQSRDNLISQLTDLQSDIIHQDERISFEYYPNNTNTSPKTASGVDSFQLLYNNNENTPTIKLRQAYYILDQVNTLSCLCDTYYSLLNSHSVNNLPDSFSLFFEMYRDKISTFLSGVINDTVKLRPTLSDTISDDNYPSETQIIKNYAERMLRSSWFKS